MHKRLTRCASALAIALGASGWAAATATAQESEAENASGPQESAGPQADGREVVVVTANKREESVQDIAVAVTAVTSDAKQELGIISVSDLTNVTPGLSYTPGNERVTLRGIGRLSNAFGADPGVANYNDGVYTAFAVFAGKDPMLIDRVEVLRGPQGTLYGRNAIGGAINTVSKRPTDEFTAEAKVGIGNYDAKKVGLAVSGPITDWLRYRAVGFKEFRDGVDPNYGEPGERTGWEIDDTYLEFQLEGDVGERLSWWFKVADLHYDKEGPPGGRTATFTTAPYLSNGGFLAAGNYNHAFPYTNDPSLIGFTQNGNVMVNPFATPGEPLNVDGEKAYNTNRQNRAQLPSYDEYIFEAVYETDWFDIKYTGGYTYYDYVLTSDPDGTPITSVTYNQISLNPVPVGTPGSSPLTIYPDLHNTYRESRSAFSNEINLISTTDGPFQWILGAYQYQDNHDQPGAFNQYREDPLADTRIDVAGYLGDVGTLGPVGAFLANVHPNANRMTSFFSNTGIQNAYGLYGQVDYQFNDQWKVQAGLRQSWDEKHSKQEAFFAGYLNSNALAFGVPIADLTGFVSTGAEGFDENGVAFKTLDRTWEATTGTIGIEYTPNDDALLFAKYSRGYKAGGFNNLTTFSPTEEAAYTDSEFVDSYELGWKQEWFDIGLTTNAALFYYDYQDAQAPLTAILDFGLPTQRNFNAFLNVPEVITQGFELESNWNPIDPLNIGFTYAYLDSEVKSDDIYDDPDRGVADPLNLRSVAGNSMAQAPAHKVSLNASYRFEMEDGSYFLPTVSYSWRDTFYDSFFNNPWEESPAFENVNARLNWRSGGGRFGVTAWVSNLTDSDQQTSQSATLRSADNTLYVNPSFTPPRMFGVDLLFNY